MFVYLLENTANGKRYVGKSVRPAERWTVHKRNARHGFQEPLYRAIRKYGVDAFEFSILEECASETASLRAETKWIERLDTTIYGHGYNQNRGGTGRAGFTHRHSEETKRKIAEALRGKKHPPERWKRSSTVVSDEELIRLKSEGHSQSAIGRMVGLSSPAVSYRFKRIRQREHLFVLPGGKGNCA